MAATYCATEQNEGDVPIRLFQIWLKPSAAGGTPRWGNTQFPKADRAGAFVPLASSYNEKGALPIHSDAGPCFEPELR